tara:strand:+ start:300 stop:971 length:672 start_codon:yes stop_codon:yes gene_type:complete
MIINKKQFWLNKIIGWENGRYNIKDVKSNFLEKFSDKFSSSLMYRQKIAINFLITKIKNKNIVELGCGSGLIANELMHLGAKSYIGIDFATNAIERAKKNTAPEYKENIHFYEKEILDIKDLKGDIIFSLGLIDWLTNEEISHLFKLCSGFKFIHSFSEKKLSPYLYLHKLYVYLSYGRKNKNYVPRYFSQNELISFNDFSIQEQIKFYTDKRLKFSKFIYNL